MFKNLIQRSLSIIAAACVTLTLLGSIDHLAQPDEVPAHWAQNTSVRG